MMKLAEALILRADIQKRFQQIQQRLLNNAKVQEGDEPSEKPEELLTEIERTSNELESLIKRINKTNTNTQFTGNKSLTDALAERDVLEMKRNVYFNLANTASVSQQRIGRSEIKFISIVDVKEIQKQADQFAKEYRELDAKIQELNWNTELVE